MFYEATDPIPVYTGMVGYSYNGVVLPEYPAWNNSEYPYLTMSSDYGWQHGYYYGLVASKTPFVYDATNEKYAISNTSFYWVACNDGVWTAWANTNGNPYVEKDSLIWTNYDITLHGGTVMKASDPIPVYE